VSLVNAGATPLGRVGRVGYRGWQRLMGVARRRRTSVASREGGRIGMWVYAPKIG